MKIEFFPSLLSANFGALQGDINKVENIVDGFHFDVMDGHFVPNITVGAPVLSCLKSNKPFDAHLMIENPEKYIEDFAKAGASMISVHMETIKDASILDDIRKLGCKAGIVFNPPTELDLEICEFADFVLIMSVNPGFGGQSFITETLEKVRAIRKKYPEKDIQIDGGINAETVKLATEAGANWIVSGSYFWGSENREKTAEILKGEENQS